MRFRPYFLVMVVAITGGCVSSRWVDISGPEEQQAVKFTYSQSGLGGMCLTWGTITSEIGRVVLTGTKDRYTEKDLVFLDEYDKPVRAMARAVGSITIDRRHGTVDVSLTMPSGKDSSLNGRYRIKRKPNQSTRANGHRPSFSAHDSRTF